MDAEKQPEVAVGGPSSGGGAAVVGFARIFDAGAGGAMMKPNIEYIKTVPGMLKLAEILLFLLAFSLASGFGQNTSGQIGFFTFVMVMGWLGSIFFFLKRFLSFESVLAMKIPRYSLVLVITYAVGAFFIFAIVIAMFEHCVDWRATGFCSSILISCSSLEAGTAFGFFAFLAVCLDTVIHFMQYRNEESAPNTPAPAPVQQEVPGY